MGRGRKPLSIPFQFTNAGDEKMFDMSAEDKIRAARVRLQKDNPFFGYLVLHLDLRNAPDKTKTAGVDFRGRLYYNPEFIDSLSIDQCKGLVCHEVMHLALKGKMRKGSREHQKWNVAQDAVINHIIQKNGFDLPENGITPDRNGDLEITVNGEEVQIHNLDDHSFESVYEQLPDGDGGGGGSDKDEDGEGDDEGFDDHIYEGEGDEEVQQDEKNWDEIVAKASSQSQGDTPAGLDGRLEQAKKEQIDWRQMLQSIVTQMIPHNYTMQRPSRITQVLRHQGHNVYLPDTEKEHVDVVVAMDTSGSMGAEEMKRNLGEVASIVSAFESVKLTVLKHTAEVYDSEEFDNPSPTDFEDMEFKSGGTDHRPVFEWLEENKPDAQLLVNFTDGYTSVPEKPPFDLETLWILDNFSVDENDLRFGQIVRMQPDEE